MSDNNRSIIPDKSIDQYIAASKLEEAKTAALYRLASDIDYEEKLSLAVTFIQKIHPDKMEQWIAGFVNESITAYTNSINPVSCSKGIRERIATGLRGIDSELDKLFAQAEAPLLVKNWLKSWNLLDLKDEAKQELVKQLKAKGITGESNATDAANAFSEIAKEQLTTHGISGNEDLLDEIEVYAESMVKANYTEVLKGLIDKKNIV